MCKAMLVTHVYYFELTIHTNGQDHRIFQTIHSYAYSSTAQKMKFSIKDFSCKCDQIRSALRIWSYLLEKSLMENFVFCAVKIA